MTDIYRTLRVIEVVGTLEFINTQKQKDQLKGALQLSLNGVNCYLHSAYLGEPTLVLTDSGDNDDDTTG